MTVEQAAYAKHQHLKKAAEELGMPWQTLYSRLKDQGVTVGGDKLRYGTDRDKLGALGESEFHRLVPASQANNAVQSQAKWDFTVNGYKVDVKASMKRQLNPKYAALSWAFSFKKQTLICDFICCFCMDEERKPEHILLVPSEFFKGLQTVSVSCTGASKWLDYAIKPEELAPFFDSLKPIHKPE